ncbi:hypothetical protein LTR84_012291 [Exophiala bonariae]|uniref:NAD(P)-binding protein n=1 Tax=Exophiala bonariae TaxID=1690606 RepID=A0AAV9NGA5_9EURO|nr:hypothetical protein LTR84_012291 [Exophiala bonariae]
MAVARKTILITGCTVGGIGGGLAEVFLEKGYHVFAGLRNPSKASPTLTKSSHVTLLTLDVLRAESITSAVERVTTQTGGKLDILLNNSGGNLILPGLDVPIEKAKQMFDLNFWAPVAMIQAFAPLLIKARGTIVNNTSVNAVVPMPLMSMYNASKAALATASDTWRIELEPLGVRVIALATMGVKTNAFVNKTMVELPKSSQYWDIREFIYGIYDGRLQSSGITTNEYAQKVYHEVESGVSGITWVGGGAGMARFSWWLFPRSLRDMLVESIMPFKKEMAKASQKKKV